jgi:hypothetical protein
MQTQISTTETSLLGSGLLFETNPPGSTGPIDPPDNTGGGGTTAPAPQPPTEEDTSSDSE